MASYTFYLCTIDGSSTSFEVLEVESDGQTAALARMMLSEQQNCDYVAVWDGRRPVRFEPRRPAKVNRLWPRLSATAP